MKRKLTDQELQDPATWDYEKAELREPVKEPRAIVSVAFRNSDFAVVSEAADRHRQRLSEFIREAALEKATGRVPFGLCTSGTPGVVMYAADRGYSGVKSRLEAEEQIQWRYAS